MRANADLGANDITSTVIATRGERLILTRAHASISTSGPKHSIVDALNIFEIDAR